MRPRRSKETLFAQALLDGGRHAVLRINLALFGLPEMVGNEFEGQGLGRRPGEGGAGCRQRPGLQIGKIGGEGAQGVFAHALVDQMTERFDVLVGQQFGQFVATVDRQHAGDGVELVGAPIDGGLGVF